MPNYDYFCSHCDQQMEVFQKITAEPLKSCPSCSQEGIQRMIGGKNAALRFVGSGFYINDYKTSSPASCSNPSSCPCKKE